MAGVIGATGLGRLKIPLNQSKPRPAGPSKIERRGAAGGIWGTSAGRRAASLKAPPRSRSQLRPDWAARPTRERPKFGRRRPAKRSAQPMPGIAEKR